MSEKVEAAVKVIDPEQIPEGRERFLREVHALAELRHPAVVRLIGFGEDDRLARLWLAMEFIPGIDLRTHITQGPIPARRAVRWLAPIAEAMGMAHERGIYHRDIKPANVVIGPGGAVLVDFGIAMQKEQTRLTQTGMLLGTPAYMPPELFAGEQSTAGRADTYALGLVLYESLAGETAFDTTADLSDGQKMVALMGCKLGLECLDPGEAVPSKLRDLVRCATSRDPAQRPTDMYVLADMLEDSLGVDAAPRFDPTRKYADLDSMPPMEDVTDEVDGLSTMDGPSAYMDEDDSTEEAAPTEPVRVERSPAQPRDDRDTIPSGTKSPIREKQGRSGMVVAAVGVAGVIGVLGVLGVGAWAGSDQVRAWLAAGQGTAVIDDPEPVDTQEEPPPPPLTPFEGDARQGLIDLAAGWAEVPDADRAVRLADGTSMAAALVEGWQGRLQTVVAVPDGASDAELHQVLANIGPGTLIVVWGAHEVTAPLTFVGAQHTLVLGADGATLSARGGGSVVSIEQSADVLFDGLVIRQDAAPFAGYVELSNDAGGTVVYAPRMAVAHAVEATNSERIRLVDCRLHGGLNGLWAKDAKSLSLARVILDGSTAAAIALEGSQLRIDDAVVYEAGNTRLRLAARSGAPALYDTEGQPVACDGGRVGGLSTDQGAVELVGCSWEIERVWRDAAAGGKVFVDGRSGPIPRLFYRTVFDVDEGSRLEADRLTVYVGDPVSGASVFDVRGELEVGSAALAHRGEVVTVADTGRIKLREVCTSSAKELPRGFGGEATLGWKPVIPGVVRAPVDLTLSADDPCASLGAETVRPFE